MSVFDFDLSLFRPRLVIALAAIGFSTSGAAGETDWPQWRGLERDGHAAEQSLLQRWPDGGPSQLWAAKNLGEGYSAVSVADGRVYTMGARDDQALAICLDLKDGQLIWETPVSRASTQDDYTHNWGGGPRSTPTVDDDQLFVLTDIGVAAALDLQDGTLQWSVNLVEELGGSIPNWGYSESPLVDGDRVVVTPGEENFLVGLDRSSGEKIWSSQGIERPAQYVSVMRHEVDGLPIYITASKPGLLGIHAETGELLFENASTGNNVAVIPTAIPTGNLLYHTSAYGAGNLLLELHREGDTVRAQQRYHLHSKSMENHHGGVVLHDGVIYGFSKSSGGVWMAQDLESGDTLWEERLRPNRSGSIAFADGRLYCYNDVDGTVHLAEPNREAWISHGMLTLPEQTDIPRGSGAIWAHPVIADGKLLIRDQDLLFVFDISR